MSAKDEEKKEIAPLAESGPLSAWLERRGIDQFTWRALTSSVFPGAAPESILLAADYCKARGLDVLKKPVHIVPMSVKNAKTGKYEWRDVIMPGISELRMTAMRTGEYVGQDDPEYGDAVEYKGVTAPEWCRIKVWRLIAGQPRPFSHTEFFAEAVAIKKEEGAVNAMWTKRPIGQLTKTAEAGALRKAFPEELGNQYSAEEMAGKSTDEEGQEPLTHVKDPPPPTQTKTQAVLDQLKALNCAPAITDIDATAVDEPAEQRDTTEAELAASVWLEGLKKETWSAKNQKAGVVLQLETLLKNGINLSDLQAVIEEIGPKVEKLTPEQTTELIGRLKPMVERTKQQEMFGE